MTALASYFPQHSRAVVWTTKLKDLHHLLSPDQKNAQGGLARLDVLHTFGSILLPSKQPR